MLVTDFTAFIAVIVPVVFIIFAITLSLKSRFSTTVDSTDNRLLEMVDLLNEELGESKHELWMMRDLISHLSAQVIGMGGKPVTMSDIENLSDNKSVINRLSTNRAEIVRILRDEFSTDELSLIAVELGIKAGLGDGSVDALVHRLITYAETNHQMRDLSLIILRDRQNSFRKD